MKSEAPLAAHKLARQSARILLLEDDESFAALLRAFLRTMIWDASTSPLSTTTHLSGTPSLEVVGTLAAALERLAARHYDLIIADLNLPDSSGLDTLKALRRGGERLILVITGEDDVTLAEAALEGGAYDFLPKSQMDRPVLKRLVRLATIQAGTVNSLRTSEARFRSLVMRTSDWYWEQDEEFRFTGLEGAGLPDNNPPDLIGKRAWEIDGIEPVSCTWQEHRAVLEAHKPFRDFEYSRPAQDGQLHYVSMTGEPVYDAKERFCGYRGLAMDVTARKLAEAHQATLVRYGEKVSRLGQSALVVRQPGELASATVQTVLEGLGADAVAYLELGPGVREVVLRTVVGLSLPPKSAVTVFEAASALGHVLQRGAAVLLDAATSTVAPLPFEWAERLRSAVLVAVRGEQGARGALCALAHRSRAFGTAEAKFVELAASVLSAGLQRVESEGRLAFLAQFDGLTGLPNRALLSDRFAVMIEQARRRGALLAVLFIDLDEFKIVNDTLGHAAGDELLKETALRLQSCVRAGDTVARISGDEFAVVLVDLTRTDDAAAVAQKIIGRLAQPFVLRGQEVFITASIGLAVFPADGADPEALIGAADAAMYRAKQAGRNTYHFYTAEINQRTRARVQLGAELRHALEREEFTLVYQAKYDLQSAVACAAEALLRWKHPERGMVSPADFIPVLEETGLIVAVGEWVLRRACRDIKAWQAAGLRRIPIAVNLSARQFRQQDLDSRILTLVASTGVDPDLIELEITESQLMQDPDHAIRLMRSLHESGIRIAIDDFGTGYSSLSYLTRFPVSSLKIDRSFVAGALSDQADAAIVRTIIEMARTLGFVVVAEGVETEQQAAFLRGLGCHQAQGYFFAKPKPAAEFTALITKA